VNIRTLRGTAAFALGFGLLLSTTLNAKTLYVDGNVGDDSVTWANNSASTPWRTIGRAVWGSTNKGSPNPSQAAQAGDVVNVAAGTYSSSLSTGGGRWDVLYNPVNDGTSSSPIRIVATGTVGIRAQTWNGPVIGANSANYVTWSGPFLIDETYIRTAPDTGPVVLTGSIGSGVDGITIHGAGATWADNHVGVRMEPCQQCFVRNTTIDNFHSQTGYTRNGAAIMLYDNDDAIIENNEFFNCGTGVSIKGARDGSTQERTIIRNNIIRNMTVMGVFIQHTARSRVYQNIVRNVPIAFFLSGTPEATQHPVEDLVANNTVDSANWGIYYNGFYENVRFRNNIFSNTQYAHLSESQTGVMSSTTQNNVYGSSTVGSFVGANFTFDSWRSVTGQDTASPGSLVADPQFVNRTSGDFRLQAGSPARSIGVDLLDLDRDGSTSDIVPVGAYVTGNERIGPGVIRPNPPGGLSAD
jgi:hypothetical protein